jgi:hypothetical protein
VAVNLRVTASVSRLRTFDPLRLGRLERDAWAAYYRREWWRAMRAFLGLVQAGYGFGPRDTLLGAWYVLRANQRWAPYPDNDPPGAERAMARFYALVERVHGEPADPARCASLEVAWWRAHREHQRESGRLDAIVDALTALYAEAYSAAPEDVRPAAVHRADAMTASDEWVDRGCRPDDPLLETERAALVRSYAALLAAVHRP